MRMNKVFNPALVIRTFTESRRSEFPSTKTEAKDYAIFLAEGLTFWATIDIIATITLLFVSLFVALPGAAILLFIAIALGSPAIMTAGIGFGCMHHLTFNETYLIIRTYFTK